jgi:hypothetical protein
MQKSGRIRPLSQHAGAESYFGAGVVVPLEDFLLFLPPLWLWPFFPALFVLAGGVVVLLSPAPLSAEPPACANDKLAPSSSVNAIVSSFFIGLLENGCQFFGIVQLCKELLCTF